MLLLTLLLKIINVNKKMFGEKKIIFNNIIINFIIYNIIKNIIDFYLLKSFQINMIQRRQCL